MRPLPRRSPRLTAIATLGLLAAAPALAAADSPKTEYLSDHEELLVSTQQDWGVLGLDVAAHQPDSSGLPLKIGDRSYARGLGHHANGVIEIVLDGQYESFSAEVGIQPIGSSEGSVVFRVVVDGQVRYDSGVLRPTDGPKAVSIPLQGASVLQLRATDAGDGISCDMANWAEARLVRSPAASPPPAVVSVNIAPFARVVSWDANRTNGSRASRIEEFLAEDLFLETDVPPRLDGTFVVPLATNGVGCLGLQWLNRRSIKELALEFNDPGRMPEVRDVHVEAWQGESAWQGNWKPWVGQLRIEGSRMVFRTPPGRPGAQPQVQKVRWVFAPSQQPLVVQRLLAFTRSRWTTARLRAWAEATSTPQRGTVSVYNGEFADASADPESSPAGAAPWDLSKPLDLTVRYSAPSPYKSDPTVLRFTLPNGMVSVAVEDIVSNECVYVSDFGLFVTREPSPIGLAAYKEKIAERKTVLEAVRTLPDQTMAQAMTRTHHDTQREGPVMLSLSCDNTKFVLERNGTLHFPPATVAPDDERYGDWPRLQPAFGRPGAGSFGRHLDGDWLPIPIITATNGGVVYTQHSFVAPADQPGTAPGRLNRSAVCVVEFSVANPLPKPAQASLALNFVADGRAKQAAQLVPAVGATGVWIMDRDRILALVDTSAAGPLRPEASAGTMHLAGELAAGASARCVVLLPGNSVRGEQLWLPVGVEPLRAATAAYWTAVLAPAMQIEVPDSFVANLIRSSQVRCLIAARNEEGGRRIAPWIAAMSYGPLESEAHAVVRGMDFLGHDEFARRGLEFFIHRYNTNGFLTTGYTTFGTGWHLWTLGEHVRLDQDLEWFRRVAPEVIRVGRWIIAQTHKTRRASASGQKVAEYGLMPPGVLADWGAFAYHFCMSAYYCAALREVGNALSLIGDAEGQAFVRAAVELSDDLVRAYQHTQELSPVLPLRNGSWVPAYPSQVHSPGKLGDFFPGQDAGRSWCYDVELGAHQLVPAGILSPHGREVTSMLDHMEDAQFLADGWFDYPATASQQDWFNLGGFSKVQPYYTRNAEIAALRDDVKPFVRSYFNTIAAMVNPEILTFWEHFHHSGAWDKTHETGYFLQQTRFMLVMEHGEALWLAPLITGNWLKHGLTVAVTNAPSRFGRVGYRITSHVREGHIDASIEPPRSQPPREIVLRLRHPDGKPLRTVTVNGVIHSDFDRAQSTVRLAPAGDAVRIRAWY